MGYNDDDDIIAAGQLLKTGSDIFKTVSNVKYNQKKLEVTNNMANANLLAQMETNKIIGDSKIKKETIDKELTETKAEIETLKNNMAGYDVNYMEWFDLDDKNKGPIGEKILKDIGIRYGENLAKSADLLMLSLRVLLKQHRQ